jgi:hypothetical protein
VLSRLVLPAGFIIRIDYDPERAPSGAAVACSMKAKKKANLAVAQEHLDGPHDLQEIVEWNASLSHSKRTGWSRRRRNDCADQKCGGYCRMTRVPAR